MLAQLVEKMREVLPLLNRGDTHAVRGLVAGTAIGCQAVLEELPRAYRGVEAAAASGSFAEWGVS